MSQARGPRELAQQLSFVVANRTAALAPFGSHSNNRYAANLAISVGEANQKMASLFGRVNGVVVAVSGRRQRRRLECSPEDLAGQTRCYEGHLSRLENCSVSVEKFYGYC